MVKKPQNFPWFILSHERISSLLSQAKREGLGRKRTSWKAPTRPELYKWNSHMPGSKIFPSSKYLFSSSSWSEVKTKTEHDFFHEIRIYPMSFVLFWHFALS